MNILINIKNMLGKNKKEAVTTYDCSKDVHDWNYCTAGNRIVDIENEDKNYLVDIPMRHCKDCKRSEEKWFEDSWREYVVNGNREVSREQFDKATNQYN